MRVHYILPVLVLVLVFGAGCKRGANQWGDLEGESTDLSEGAEADVQDTDVSLSFLLPNGDEVGVDSHRISRHSRIKVGAESDPSQCKLMWKDVEVPMNEVAMGNIAQSENEIILKADKPLHNGEYTLCGVTFKTKAPGDLNADGISDMVIGGSRAFGDKGAAFIFFGKDNPEWESYEDADVTIQSSLQHGRFGKVLAVGDLNGDGIDDIAIGAPDDEATQRKRGAVYIFYGRESWNPDYVSVSANSVIRRINGDESKFGNALAMGDINGDGFDDLIVGERDAHNLDNAGGINAGTGAAHLFLGSKDGLAPQRLVTDSEQGDMSFYAMTASLTVDAVGAGVASGDVNEDGIDDVIIGAPMVSPQNQPGRVYVMLGGRDVANKGASLSLENVSKVEQKITIMGTEDLGVSVAAYTLSPEKDGILLGSKGLAFSYEYEEGNPLGLVDQLGLGPVPQFFHEVLVGWLGVGIGIGAPVESLFFFSDYPPQDWQVRPQGQSVPMTSMGCSMSSIGDINADGKPDFAYGECEGISNVTPGVMGGVVYVNINGVDMPITGTRNPGQREQFGSAIAGGRIR